MGKREEREEIARALAAFQGAATALPGEVAVRPRGTHYHREEGLVDPNVASSPRRFSPVKTVAQVSGKRKPFAIANRAKRRERTRREILMNKAKRRERLTTI